MIGFEFRKFLADEGGAVTIDWVALTAGILLLGIAVVYSIFGNGVAGAVDSMIAALDGVNPVETGAAPDFGEGTQVASADYSIPSSQLGSAVAGTDQNDLTIYNLTYPDADGVTQTLKGVQYQPAITDPSTRITTYAITNSAGNVVATETAGPNMLPTFTVVGDPYPYVPPSSAT